MGLWEGVAESPMMFAQLACGLGEKRGIIENDKTINEKSSSGAVCLFNLSFSISGNVLR